MPPGLLTVRLQRKQREAVDICSFELVDPAGGTLPPYGAGAHIDVHIRDGLVRQYSLIDAVEIDPAEPRRGYRIAVLRDPAGRGGSRAMHDDLAEGDLLRIGQPRNLFPLAPGGGRSLLLAGGIGITPILCMAQRLSAAGAGFTLHYCARSADRMAFREAIAASPFADRVVFHVDDGPAGQRLDLAGALAGGDGGGHLYVCGPAGFNTAVVETAQRQGWRDGHIHFESFTAAKGVAPSAAAAGGDRDFLVTLASSGKSYTVPPGRTVVEVLAAHGVDIPTSCEQGICGTCLTGLLDGEPDHRDQFLTNAERARNDRFTPCCSRAKSRTLLLDL